MKRGREALNTHQAVVLPAVVAKGAIGERFATPNARLNSHSRPPCARLLFMTRASAHPAWDWPRFHGLVTVWLDAMTRMPGGGSGWISMAASAGGSRMSVAVEGRLCSHDQGSRSVGSATTSTREMICAKFFCLR